MKHKYQCECMDDNCRTVIVGPDNRLDGIRCPRCRGPVNVKPFEHAKRHTTSDRAFFVREKILERNLDYCRDLSPEQVDAVLKIADEYKKENKLLSIELDTINSVPKVFYKGEEITKKMRVSFDWETRRDGAKTPTFVHIQHADPINEGINTMTIKHNQPIE